MIKQFQNFSNKKDAGSKGAISVIVALSVLTIILTIGLSTSSIISGELSLSGDASESAKAYYAAETGIERAMYERFRGGGGGGAMPGAAQCGVGPGWEPFSPAQYCLVLTCVPVGCASFNDITAIKSIGEYGSVRRSVQISF